MQRLLTKAFAILSCLAVILLIALLLSGCPDGWSTDSFVISHFEPMEGCVGDEVFIWGTFLGSTSNDKVYFFDGLEAPMIYSDSSLKHVTVPEGAQTGKITVALGYSDPQITKQSKQVFTVLPPD